MRGFGTPSTADDLFDCHQELSQQERRTHVGGEELDRILVSSSFAVKDVQNRRDLIVRATPDQGAGVNYDHGESEQDLSDHYPLVAKLSIGDGPVPFVGGPGPQEGDIVSLLEAIEQRLSGIVSSSCRTMNSPGLSSELTNMERRRP